MSLGHETEQVEFKKFTSELKEGAVSVVAILNKPTVEASCTSA